MESPVIWNTLCHFQCSVLCFTCWFMWLARQICTAHYLKLSTFGYVSKSKCFPAIWFHFFLSSTLGCREMRRWSSRGWREREPLSESHPWKQAVWWVRQGIGTLQSPPGRLSEYPIVPPGSAVGSENSCVVQMPVFPQTFKHWVGRAVSFVVWENVLC